LETVRDIAAEGLGAIICCHDPNHILWFCDQVAALKNGRLLAVDPSRTRLIAASWKNYMTVPSRLPSRVAGIYLSLICQKVFRVFVTMKNSRLTTQGIPIMIGIINQED